SLDLRFRALAAVQGTGLLAGAGLSVLFAVLGFGAYSFVLPALVTAPAVTAALLALARPPLRLAPEWGRWRGPAGAGGGGGALAACRIISYAILQGDYILLGLFCPAEVVGLYYFAYTFSAQAVVLLGNNVVGVLFPSLSLLREEPLRQRAAFLRAARLLMALMVPASLLLVAVAGPAVHLVFGDKWAAAVPVIQVLAAGTATRVLGALPGACLQPRGRFDLLVTSLALYGVIFFALAALALPWGLLAFASAVSAAFVAGPAVQWFFALGAGRGAAKDLWDILRVP